MNDRVKKIVVHIGSHKAGSTAIQDFCSAGERVLKPAGIFYPTGVFREYPRQHSHIVRLLAARAHAELKDALAQISRLAREQSSDTVFLSGEDLCTLREKDIIEFSELCELFFDEKEFVFILRNRRDFLISSMKHHLTYVQMITEDEFLRYFWFSPRRSYESWKAHFSALGKIILYDDVKENLIGEFFNSVFSVKAESSNVSNSSFDLLTVYIKNIFLKEYRSDFDAILWNFSQQFRDRLVFRMEEKLADDCVRCSSDDDWIMDDLPDPRVLLRERPKSQRSLDPIQVCDRMIALFTALRAQFEKTERRAQSTKNDKG